MEADFLQLEAAFSAFEAVVSAIEAVFSALEAVFEIGYERVFGMNLCLGPTTCKAGLLLKCEWSILMLIRIQNRSKILAMLPS